MTKGVFVIRSDSPYDDQPEIHYQFPAQYLSRASQLVGDWVLYYEPVKGGARGYHAAVKVRQIVPDPTRAAHYLALIEPGSYRTFEYDVPFRIAGQLVEQGVLNEEGQISGRAQAAVRPLSEEDFDRILTIGLPDEAELLPRSGALVAEDHAPFDAPRDRELEENHHCGVDADDPAISRFWNSMLVSQKDSQCGVHVHVDQPGQQADKRECHKFSIPQHL